MVSTLTGALIAAVAGTAAAVPTDLTGYGALGILATASLAGSVIVYRDQRRQITDSNARADRISAEKDALAKDVMEKVIPVLTQAVSVMGVYAELQRRGTMNG